MGNCFEKKKDNINPEEDDDIESGIGIKFEKHPQKDSKEQNKQDGQKEDRKVTYLKDDGEEYVFKKEPKAPK